MQGNKRILAALGGIAALFVTAAPAFAVMSAPYGWYLEGNLGTTHLSNRTYGGDVDSPGLGANLNLGYKFMPYVAGEMGYTSYANTIIRANGQKAGTDRFDSYDIAAKGILPLGDIGFEPFAKVGVSRLSSSITANDSAAATNLGLTNKKSNATGLYIGAGAQYYFMPELAVVVQIVSAYGNDSTGNQYLFSGGLSFIFD